MDTTQPHQTTQPNKKPQPPVQQVTGDKGRAVLQVPVLPDDADSRLQGRGLVVGWLVVGWLLPGWLLLLVWRLEASYQVWLRD